MGIARLVATGRPDVLDRLPTEICNMWIDVFGELREAIERAADEGYAVFVHTQRPHTERLFINSEGKLTLYWDRQPEELFEDCKDTLEYGRRVTVCVRCQICWYNVTNQFRAPGVSERHRPHHATNELHKLSHARSRSCMWRRGSLLREVCLED